MLQLARQVDYSFQLYQLYKLKAAKFQSLLRDAQTKAGDRETEIEQLKASISGISSAEKTELENLRVELIKLKETHAEGINISSCVPLFFLLFSLFVLLNMSPVLVR